RVLRRRARRHPDRGAVGHGAQRYQGDQGVEEPACDLRVARRHSDLHRAGSGALAGDVGHAARRHGRRLCGRSPDPGASRDHRPPVRHCGGSGDDRALRRAILVLGGAREPRLPARELLGLGVFARSGYRFARRKRAKRNLMRRHPGAGFALGSRDLDIGHLLGDFAAVRDRVGTSLERRQVEPFVRRDEVDHAGTAARPIHAALEQHVLDCSRSNRDRAFLIDDPLKHYRHSPFCCWPPSPERGPRPLFKR
ncbi:hypothetical protein chiPu_0030359, partial [Chiloscyllium punctatum]|nr:hypothetical protein [Chiloscyllium punctatum]